MLVNDTLGYSDGTERLINRKYVLKDNFQARKKLEKLLADLVNYSQTPELKLGLEILLLLVSHKNENVRAPALAKMFVLMDDGLIQELVIKELKNVSNNGDGDSSESAEYSLDVIASEIHKFEVMDAVCDVCIELKNRFTNKARQLKCQGVFSSRINSRSIGNSVFHSNALYNRFICKLRALNRKLDRMVPYLEEIENYSENIIEYKELHCLDVHDSKSSEKKSLKKLAGFYASTFAEKGHLRRLISLLGDDDYDVQQIGANALIEIVEVLLKDSAAKRIIKPLTLSDLE